MQNMRNFLTKPVTAQRTGLKFLYTVTTNLFIKLSIVTFGNM